LSAPAAKSLKEQNRWQLWLVVAANVVVFYFVLQSDALSTAGFKGIFATVSNLLPIGLAFQSNVPPHLVQQRPGMPRYARPQSTAT